MTAHANGGPAFPRTAAFSNAERTACTEQDGMTLRDYFAAKAMAEMIGGTWPDGADMFEISRRSYAMADAMLKARSA